MKKRLNLKANRPLNRQKASTKTLMKIEGKFLHGTFGKPGNGPRGNKKY